VHYNDVDDAGRTSWRTRPRGTLAAAPISELALIIGVAQRTAQLLLMLLLRRHNGAAWTEATDRLSAGSPLATQKKHSS